MATNTLLQSPGTAYCFSDCCQGHSEHRAQSSPRALLGVAAPYLLPEKKFLSYRFVCLSTMQTHSCGPMILDSTAFLPHADNSRRLRTVSFCSCWHMPRWIQEVRKSKITGRFFWVGSNSCTCSLMHMCTPSGDADRMSKGSFLRLNRLLSHSPFMLFKGFLSGCSFSELATNSQVRPQAESHHGASLNSALKVFLSSTWS